MDKGDSSDRRVDSSRVAADRLLQDLIKEHGTESVLAARMRLFIFFREAKRRGWISGLDPRRRDFDAMLDELVRHTQNYMGNENFTRARFSEFCQSNPQRFSLNPSYARPMIESIRKTEKFRFAPQLRNLYREIFGPETGYLPHMLNRLQREPNEKLTTRQNCKVLEDYILFRPDTSGLIRPAFFRFYEHENMCIRSMGLRLDPEHGRLSSKGWIVRQQNGYLTSGYIINRSKKDGTVKIDGGFSNLWIDSNVDSPLYHEIDGKISLSTVFHFQAPFSQIPSCARGIIIRLKGFEKKGGQYQQERSTRNIETYKLQSALMQKFDCEMTAHDCSEYLSKRSGLPKFLFEDVFTAIHDIKNILDSDFDSEALNPVAPLMPALSILKPHTLDPNDEIFIDGLEDFP